MSALGAHLIAPHPDADAGDMRGSNGYLVEQHPLLIVVGAAILLIGVWLFLRFFGRRR